MKRLFIIFLLLFVLVGCERRDPDKYEANHNVYILDTILDAEQDKLTVEGELIYYNEIADLDELYLHVYPNAIHAVGEDNVVFEYLTIDDEDIDVEFGGDDDTLVYTELSKNYQVGDKISIKFKYDFSYWNEDRILATDNYYVTMFFYPHVPVYNEDGFNPEPYSFRGESYFNTLGDYYVTINTPRTYDVAASGGLTSSTSSVSRRTRTYEIKNARDFSFSASENYEVYSHEEDGRRFEIYSLNYLAPEEEELYFNYLITSFDVMERDVGPYPYDHFTLELGEIYGMESTGVIYCSQHVDETTINHEVIHQWFYSIIHNDQSDEPFLDEALTTYTTSWYYYELYGMDGYNGYLDYRSSLKPELSHRFVQFQGQSIIRHISEYEDGYGYLVYYHGPTIYRYYVEYFLDGDIQRFKDVIKTYYDEYKYEIVTIDEFFTFLEEELEEPGTKAWLYEQANDLQDLNNEQP